MFETYNYLDSILRTNEKAFTQFKWIANVFVFTGAAAIAFSMIYSQQAWPFLINMVGSIMWLKSAQIMQERALAGYQMFFIAINTYAIILRTFN